MLEFDTTSDQLAIIKVIGTKVMLADFDPTTIEAYIDFSELASDANGLVELPLHIIGDNNFVTYTSDRLYVKVTVSK